MEAVAINTEIRDWMDYSRLTELITNGFTYFKPIDGGMAIVTKEPCPELSYEESYRVISNCRENINRYGQDFQIKLASGLVMHVYSFILPCGYPDLR